MSDVFPVQNDLNQGGALSPILLNSALEYANRKVREYKKRLKLNEIIVSGLC
jgi:retron-type reverse transcriptase